MVKMVENHGKIREKLANSSFLMGKHREKLARSGESSISSFENHGNLCEITVFFSFSREKC